VGEGFEGESSTQVGVDARQTLLGELGEESGVVFGVAECDDAVMSWISAESPRDNNYEKITVHGSWHPREGA
jgi:fructose-1,6-bisphosphatase/sedoheptulose 1,7-bisphosphatase-like protein